MPVGSTSSQSRSAIGGVRPNDVAVALAVAGIGGVVQALPFDLKWLTSTMNRAPSVVSNACAIEGRLRGKVSPPFTNSALLRAAVVPIGRHRRGAVEEADLDRVGAGGVELAGLGVDIDEGVGAFTGGVQLVDEVGDRAVGP